MKENSIEEDIERLKLCSSNQCHICGRYEKEECMLERNRCEQHILSAYKRVLKEAKRYKNMYKAEHEIHLVRNEQLDRKENAVTKCNELIIENAKLKEENEELKQDRNNNYQMIALAQNEMLGYMQGYEDGKKLNRSAVACVVENQQYYIIKKEIEHYKEWIEKLQKKNEELEEINNELEAEKNEAIRRYNFETIPKQKVKDKIEKLKGKLEDISKRREKSKTKEEETVLWCLEIRTDERIKTLQELL